jgi:hypothetical protein
MNKQQVLTVTSVAVALLLLLAQTMPVLAASLVKGPTLAKWTFMVYMNGDNNLEKYVTSDIERELAQPGSNADVNVVALADRIPGYDASAGDWTSTKLFYITKGMQATPQNAVADWGERDMGDPQTLVDFVQWAKKNYPANRYALILWDHGWGWRPDQTMWDETSQDALDPDEIITAMKGAGPVDVIGYDACEGQMIEVQATWRNYAGAIAGSQEDVGYHGFEYNKVLPALQANPNMTAADLAIQLAQSMMDWTSSAVVLDPRWDNLLTAVDQWASALLKGLPTYRAAYDAAYLSAQGVADPTNKDLYDAAAEIKAKVGDPDIQARSQAVMDAVNAVTPYEWHHGKYKGAHGIGIFWPRLPADLDEPSSLENDFEYYRSKLVFSKLTHWDEFISAYVLP